MTQPTTTAQFPIGRHEFITLVACMTSLIALAIDTMLPAMPMIAHDFSIHDNSHQLVISIIFAGMAVGQLIYGPLSDAYGRKPIIYTGFIIFIGGCLLAMFADDFTVLLIGRVLQGFGAAAPKTIVLAIVRDRFSGRAMASIMSFIMTIFVLIPVIAPSIGQLIIMFAHWRLIFAFFVLLAVLVALWFALRLPETLPIDQRRAPSFSNLLRAFTLILRQPNVLRFTLVNGLVLAAFIHFLSTCHQLFQSLYGIGEQFPLYFGLIALSLGIAALVNGRLVLRFGMFLLVIRAASVVFVLSLGMLIYVGYFDQDVNFIFFFVYLVCLFFSYGFLFGNLNALAMEPLGNVAGIGASFIGFISIVIALPIAIVFAESYDHTLMPLLSSFSLLAALTLALLWPVKTKHAP